MSEKKIKCVVWDLDNTIWDGTLLEDGKVILKETVIQVIKQLDAWGILNSIASRNNYEETIQQLKVFEIDQYFLYPQIGWNAKSTSLDIIAKDLNLSLDALAFIDDQQFELDEVKFNHPKVKTIHADDINRILEIQDIKPVYITEDSKNRRAMYQNNQMRDRAEEEYAGPKNSFLDTLDMILTIKPATEEDLRRAEELTMRTHQMNTTGYVYSYDTLNKLITDPNYKLYIYSLDDKFGTYGKIGITLLKCNDRQWTIKLLLMSCRVMSRGIGSAIISYIINEANRLGVRLLAEFKENNKNRMMYITYKMNDFVEIEHHDDIILLEHVSNEIKTYPNYMDIVLQGANNIIHRLNRNRKTEL